MPQKLPENILENADAAVENAQRVRRYHRRRTEKKSAQRATDIDIALARIREAMKPIKSERGRFTYGPQTDLAERNRQAIIARSLALQKERRKLWKMKGRDS